MLASLFAYCVEALHLSEDATCSRIEAARASRRFPVILDLLASGSLTLTSVRRLARHLTPKNHEGVLARASGRSLQEVEVLVAELAPRPDVPTSVRGLPAPPSVLTTESPRNQWNGTDEEVATGSPSPTPAVETAPAAIPPARRPTIQATSPQRYRVQLTIGQDTHDKLRRLQVLLRREIPDGDAAAIFDRAITLLLEKVEKDKLAEVKRPRPPKPVIRLETDNDIRTPGRPSRYMPAHVKRSVRARDGDRCAFVSADGHRCKETAFLEFHHAGRPWAWNGPATVENISLRCRSHNQYEAKLIFGPRLARTLPAGTEFLSC